MIVEYTGKTCNLVSYKKNNQNDELTDVPIVEAATAYNAPTVETYIHVLPQSLYLGNVIEYSLLCPNQMRHNGLIVDNVPRHLAPDPTTATHSIYMPEEGLRIPLEIQDVVSYFDTRTPTTQELEDCKRVLLTADTEWDPHSEQFMMNERAFNASRPSILKA
jgi:hypothetical protein